MRGFPAPRGCTCATWHKELRYDPGTIDCDLEGFLWWEGWFVVLDATSEIRTCLELAVIPPA